MIVSIDGLRADAAQRAPTLVRLAARGAATWQAETVVPSITLNAHASMLSGFGPGRHGMTWGTYEARRGTIAIPTVFSLARAAGLRTAMIVGKDKLAHLNAPGSTDVFVVAAGDDDVAERAASEVQAGNDLVFAHLPDTDVCGHRWRWMSNECMGVMSQADRALDRILAATSAHTTVIVTSDHGGSGLDHFAPDPRNLTIPWVIGGPGVAHGLALSTRVRTMDTAATSAFVLGLDASAMEGRPVLEAFAGSSLRLPSVAAAR